MRRLHSLVYTVMHGSWVLPDNINALSAAGGAQYVDAFNEYDPAMYEDDTVYSSPEPSDTEEAVQKKADFKVKRVSRSFQET